MSFGMASRACTRYYSARMNAVIVMLLSRVAYHLGDFDRKGARIRIRFRLKLPILVQAKPGKQQG